MELTKERTHTPAPWHTATTESDIYILDSSDQIVAICVTQQLNGTYWGEFEKQENAELIASAPLLNGKLTALRAEIADYRRALEEIVAGYEFPDAKDTARSTLNKYPGKI